MDADAADSPTPWLALGASDPRRIGDVEDDPGFRRRPGYERARDGLVASFRADGHDPELWRARVLHGDWSGDTTVVLCETCGYAVTLNPQIARFTRYRGRRCSDAFAATVQQDQERAGARTARGRRVMRRVLLAMPVLMVALITTVVIVTDEFRPVFLVPIGFWSLVAYAAWNDG